MMYNELLKERILDSAIRGELVAQNANDESSDKLIQRILKIRDELIEKKEIRKDNNVKLEKPNVKLPNGWNWIRLGDIGSFKKGPFGSSLTKDMFVEDGPQSIKVYEQKNAIQKNWELGNYFITKDKFETMQSFIVKPNDIIVSCAGTIGEIYVIPEDARIGIINQALMKITLHDNSIMDYFLLYFDHVLKGETREKGKGCAITNIPPFDILKNIYIPLPPLEEQKRIVEKIEQYFELIDRKEKNDQEKEKLRNLLKEKILDSAIRGELLKNNKEMAKYESPLFNIPSSWKWVTFSDIAIIVRGGSPRPIKDYLTESENGINWIKIGDTSPNEYYINKVKEKIKPEGMKKSRFVEKGSLLLTNSMSFGRPYILNVDGCIHDGWLNIKDNNDNFYNLYMVYLLSSKYFYNIMCDKSSGAVVSNLNIDKVKSMLIPLPPLEEQHRIVEKIEQCFELIEQL